MNPLLGLENICTTPAIAALTMTNTNVVGDFDTRLGTSSTKQLVQIAVNGTLMRGFELNANLLNLGAAFLREDLTEKAYRLFSIDDVHPGMVRVPAPGFETAEPVSVVVEVWSVPASGVATLLQKEPAGLSIGKVRLQDGATEIMGVLAEPALVKGKKDISEYPGDGKASFRDYVAVEGMRIINEALDSNMHSNNSMLAMLKTYCNVASAHYNNGEVAAAITLLNRAIKMLGLKDRLYLNLQL